MAKNIHLGCSAAKGTAIMLFELLPLITQWYSGQLRTTSNSMKRNWALGWGRKPYQKVMVPMVAVVRLKSLLLMREKPQETIFTVILTFPNGAYN